MPQTPVTAKLSSRKKGSSSPKIPLRRDYTKAISEVLPDLIFVFDRKGNFIDYKPSHFGGPRIPAEHFIGKNIAEVLPMHVTVASLEAMQQAFAHGGVRMIEYEGIVNGKEHIFEGRYIAMNTHEAMAIIRDITDRKEIEERLEQRNFEMHTLVDNLLLGVVMESEERYVTQANNEFFKLFNFSPLLPEGPQENGVELTKKIGQLCVDTEKFITHANDIAHHLQKVPGEEWILKDGRVIEVEYMPICHEGICRGHLWMYRDITEHKKIDQLKSEFVSVASHQLRTPLTGIKWIGELLLKGKAGTLQANQQELIQQLVETNERMIVLVNDLLNVSRIESGKNSTLELRSEDLTGLIKSIVEELQPVAAKKQVTVTLSGGTKKLFCSCDAAKLRQALGNVMSNAIKYSPAKTSVEISLKSTDAMVIISCRDQGIGIPKEDQARLFEKFFRASNAIKHEAEGTGLGLYIARAIITAHQGTMWFESTVGKGTTFFISLPRLDNAN